MTLTEAKDILINRLDFRVTEASPASGRFFEAENHFITTEMIKDCQPTENISDGDFTTYLTVLKNDCVFEVLGNVFNKDKIDDGLLDKYPSLFDDLLSMSMAIRVLNLIMTSTRSNRNERIGKDSLMLLYLELNGNSRDHNFPFSKGLEQKYKDELMRVKVFLFTQKRFKTVTIG